MNEARTVIAGGGWAGLAAAVELSAAGRAATVLEAAPQPGGRARRVIHDGHPLDNGQHLLIGAYTEILRLLAVIGMPEEKALHRLPLVWDMRAPGGDHLHLTLPRLSAPLHVAAGLLRARGLRAGEKFAALRLCAGLLRRGFLVEPDTAAAGWLIRMGQPPRLIKLFWEPLCLAALNTPLASASMRTFARVLGDAFARSREHSDLLIPRADLSALFPDPARAFIEQRGGQVRTGTRVTGLIVEADRVRGVHTAEGDIAAGHVILAVPATAAARLLAPHPALAPIAESLNAIGHEPIATIYLRYPATIRLDTPMLGLCGATGQWVFDLALRGEPGWMAVVISGPGPHMELDTDTLARTVAEELAQVMPARPRPLAHFVIREKRATFSCRAGIDASRSGHATPVRGLWLAGDHTATGYPATLEGAARSGVACARAVMNAPLDESGYTH